MKWDDIPGWFDWEHVYRTIVTNYPGGTIVEVGTYLGRSLCFLESIVRESRKPFRVIGVDHCLGSGPEGPHNADYHVEKVQEGGGTLAGLLHNNIRECGYADSITVIICGSTIAATLFPQESLVAVFLDASHDYDSVRRDINAWKPKIIQGGMLCGDDMGIPGQSDTELIWPGVKKAVDECLPGWEYQPHDAWSWLKEK